MFARALLAFIALPGVFAFAVPIVWLLATSHAQLAQPLGLVPLIVGCLALMYVAVTLILLGWAISFASPAMFVYTVVVAIAFHLRVVFGEEPWLARTHGAQWDEYAGRVPRWF